MSVKRSKAIPAPRVEYNSIVSESRMASINHSTNPESRKEMASPPLVNDVEVSGPGKGKSLEKSHIEGISLRRAIHMEPKNRVRKTVYIEAELLEALGPCDLSFLVNLALEHRITKHPDMQVRISPREEDHPSRAHRRSPYRSCTGYS